MASPSWRLFVQVCLFPLGSMCYALLGILSQASKSEDGSYAYSLPTVVLTAEGCKLLLSCCFLTRECGSPVAAWHVVARSTKWQWLACAVPSALYSFNNNLDMLNNQHMDPATEQVLVQCKILTTGVVWWLVFREPLGARKWLSLVLLSVGAVLAGKQSEAITSGSRTMYIDPFGMLLVTIYVCVSACAGVYNEWIYKGIGKDESIHVSNIRLYAIGMLFNLGGHLASAEAGELSLRSFYRGYNVYVWGLVATYTSLGIVLSQVMKWFDNIVKLFISGSSMYISAVFAWAVFGYAPTLNFLLALALVSLAMLLYNWEKICSIHAKKA